MTSEDLEIIDKLNEPEPEEDSVNINKRER
jgi:hypothetical protein